LGYASGTVCWTPDTTHIRNVPYTFTITARDNNCPLSGQAIRSFSIFVRETPETQLQTSYLGCGNLALSHSLKKNYGTIATNWEIRNPINQLLFQSTQIKDTAFLQPGQYIVRLSVRSSVPCINQYYDTILIPDFVQVSLPKDTFVLCGASISISSKTRLGETPYLYKWKRLKASEDSILSAMPYLWLRPDTTNTYLVEVSDNLGCKNWDTIKIEQKPVFTVNIGSTFNLCKEDTSYINAGSDLKGSQYFYNWSNGDSLWATSVSEGGLFWLKVIDTAACYSVDTVLINKSKIELVNKKENNVCFGDSLIIQAPKGILPYSYKWQIMGDPDSTVVSTKGYHIATQDTLLYYKVEVRDAINCIATDTLLLREKPLPKVDLGTDRFLCKNEMVWLQPDMTYLNNHNFLWSQGNKTWRISALNLGTYWLKATDTFGCTGIGTVRVYKSNLEMQTQKENNLCIGDTVFVQGNKGIEPYFYSWTIIGDNTNTIVESKNYFVGLRDTTLSYKVEVKDAYNCKATDNIKVSVRQFPPIHLGGDIKVCPNKDNFINAGHPQKIGLYQYLWNTLDTTWQIKIMKPDTYWLKVKDTLGCTSYDTINISYSPLPPKSADIERQGDTLIARPGFWEYTWLDKNNTLLQTGPSNRFIAKKLDTYFVEASDSMKCYQTRSEFTVNMLGVNKTQTINQIVLYPNPCEAGKAFVVESESQLIGVFDSKGSRIVAEIVFKDGISEVIINKTGVFFVALTTGKYLKVVVY